jgi:hypothetical protein
MNGSGKLGILLVVTAALVAPAMAQDAQRFETFGGYSFTSGNAYVPSGTNFSGWDTSTTVFLNRWFGITSDFAGHYGAGNLQFPDPAPQGVTPGTSRDTAHAYTFLFGPHFTYRHSRYAPFVQTLFGAQHTWASSTILTEPTCTPPATCTSSPAGSSGGGSDTKFAMSAGGGLDITLGHGISIRPIQADYVLDRACCGVVVQQGVFHYFGYNNNGFRYSAGITFHFGPALGKNH